MTKHLTLSQSLVSQWCTNKPFGTKPFNKKLHAVSWRERDLTTVCAKMPGTNGSAIKSTDPQNDSRASCERSVRFAPGTEEYWLHLQSEGWEEEGTDKQTTFNKNKFHHKDIATLDIAFNTICSLILRQSQEFVKHKQTLPSSISNLG